MLVDIIIPCFNPGPELLDAIYSCQNQNYKKYKITVVDDASKTDVKKLIRDFDNLNYIRCPKNMGPAGARNFGIKQTKSELISFLDSDDIMNKNKLKLSVNAFRDKPDISMVCGNYQIIKNRIKMKRPFYSKPITINHSILMRQNFVASGSVTLKREVLNEVGLFDENLWIAEDYDLWLRISEKHKIHYIHDVLYYYSVVVGSNSLTQRGDIQALHDSNIRNIREASRKRVNAGV